MVCGFGKLERWMRIGTVNDACLVYFIIMSCQQAQLRPVAPAPHLLRWRLADGCLGPGAPRARLFNTTVTAVAKSSLSPPSAGRRSAGRTHAYVHALDPGSFATGPCTHTDELFHGTDGGRGSLRSLTDLGRAAVRGGVV